jgi:hypothetical protein
VPANGPACSRWVRLFQEHRAGVEQAEAAAWNVVLRLGPRLGGHHRDVAAGCSGIGEPNGEQRTVDAATALRRRSGCARMLGDAVCDREAGPSTISRGKSSCERTPWVSAWMKPSTTTLRQAANSSSRFGAASARLATPPAIGFTNRSPCAATARSSAGLGDQLHLGANDARRRGGFAEEGITRVLNALG